MAAHELNKTESTIRNWKAEVKAANTISLCRRRYESRRRSTSIFLKCHRSIMFCPFFFIKWYLQRKGRVREIGRWRELWPERWRGVELVTCDSRSRPSHSIRESQSEVRRQRISFLPVREPDSVLLRVMVSFHFDLKKKSAHRNEEVLWWLRIIL